MSILDPQCGENFLHPSFSSGCQVHIVKRVIRKGWGDSVWIELTKIDGSKISNPSRVFSMSNWYAFARHLVDDKSHG